jgi:catechol 2,3-dioxygenase
VHLHVGDLERGAAFYHAGLGFDKVVWGYPGALFMSAGGYHHHLGTNTWSPGPAASDADARLLSWEIVLPAAADAEGAVRSLSSAGFPVTGADGRWIAADPWGTNVRLVVER